MGKNRSHTKTESLHGGDIYRNKVELDFSVSLNPCGMPGSFRDALEDSLNRIGNYPDPEHERLKESIAVMDGVSPGDIVCGNGASELLMAAVQAFRPKKALITAPCYAGYRVALEAVGSDIAEYALNESSAYELKKDFMDMLDENTDMVFVTDPNNPNGRLIDPEIKEALIAECSRKGIILVIDECFLPLTKQGTKRPEKEDRSIRLRAFTKTFAVPGIRLGYTVCRDKEINASIRKQLPEWNVSVIAEEAGIEAASIATDTDIVKLSADIISVQRQLLEKGLEAIGVKAFPSDTVYLLLKTEPGMYEKLLERGILVRDCSNYSGLDKRFIRVAVRNTDENERLIRELKRCLGR